METKLTQLQAYDAMFKFLDIYYEQTKSDDVGSLLGSMQFLIHGSTADPAMWEDWMDSVNAVTNTEEKLTKLQAYNATIKFLDIYYGFTKSDDVGSLLGEMNFQDDQQFYPAAWERWIKCVDGALNEPEGYKETIEFIK